MPFRLNQFTKWGCFDCPHLGWFRQIHLQFLAKHNRSFSCWLLCCSDILLIFSKTSYLPGLFRLFGLLQDLIDENISCVLRSNTLIFIWLLLFFKGLLKMLSSVIELWVNFFRKQRSTLSISNDLRGKLCFKKISSLTDILRNYLLLHLHTYYKRSYLI